MSSRSTERESNRIQQSGRENMVFRNGHELTSRTLLLSEGLVSETRHKVGVVESIPRENRVGRRECMVNSPLSPVFSDRLTKWVRTVAWRDSAVAREVWFRKEG